MGRESRDGEGELLLKGSVVNGYLKFVKKSWGKQGLEDCLDECDLRGQVYSEKEFYPIDDMVKILQWISRNKGMDKVRAAGNFSIRNLGLLGFLVRFASMKQMLSQAENSYYQAFKFGKVNIDLKPKEAYITLKDYTICQEMCVGWAGAFEAMLDMTNTTGLVEEVECSLRGAPACMYHITWE